MIVDSSALIAIANDEPESDNIIARLNSSPGPIQMAAPTYLETFIVAEQRFGVQVASQIEATLRVYKIEVVPFDQELAEIARVAYRLYGKGTGHPAQLNFGDSFSYALSKRTGYPLLCHGNDFRQTDVRIA